MIKYTKSISSPLSNEHDYLVEINISEGESIRGIVFISITSENETTVIHTELFENEEYKKDITKFLQGKANNIIDEYDKERFFYNYFDVAGFDKIIEK